MKNKFIMLSAAVLLPLILLGLYRSGFIRFNYPSKSTYPVRGIDVSHHQGPIDWYQVKESGVKFVYIKATEGGDFIDSRFSENWKAADEVGLWKGAYHFFTFCKPGADQARNFINAVPLEKNNLPPVIDLEFGGNCSKRPSIEEMTKEVNAFVEMTTEHYGTDPIFYVTREFQDAYMSGKNDGLSDQTLWVRRIYTEPKQNACSEWTFWQFADQGRVPGIDGPVDMNVFCGNEHDLQKAFTQHKNGSPTECRTQLRQKSESFLKDIRQKLQSKKIPPASKKEVALSVYENKRLVDVLKQDSTRGRFLAAKPGQTPEDDLHWMEIEPNSRSISPEFCEPFMPMAYVLEANGQPSLISLNESTPSGDWMLNSDYFYRPDGTLLHLSSSLFIYASRVSGESLGIVQAMNDFYYDQQGNLLISTKELRDTNDNKLTQDEVLYYPVASEVYFKTSDLPFGKLLAP